MKNYPIAKSDRAKKKKSPETYNTSKQKKHIASLPRMKCPNCRIDLHGDFKIVYMLGRQDGRNEYEQHLNVIEKAMGRLFDELRIMDLRTPDKVNRVYFSRQFLHPLCKYLRKHHYSEMAKKIEKEIDRQIGEFMSNEAILRELLVEIKE